jgi:hypothetical protein
VVHRYMSESLRRKNSLFRSMRVVLWSYRKSRNLCIGVLRKSGGLGFWFLRPGLFDDL